MAPLTSVSAKARLHLFRARRLDRAMRIAEAIAEGETALALDPINKGALQDLSRLQTLALQVDAAARRKGQLATLDIAERRLAGRTLGAAQSFFGQIIHEFGADPQALAALRHCATLPDPARLEALRHLVRLRPDHVPTALHLLFTLRLTGAFESAGERQPAGPAIPRHVGQFWDQPELPDDLGRLRDSWAAHNPDYALRLFDDRTAEAYLAEHYPSEVRRAFRGAGEATRRADLFHLAFLAQEGGIWADIDDRCLAPLAGLVSPGLQAVFWQDQWSALGNNFIAVIPGFPLIRQALETAVRQINQGDVTLVWLSLGPGLLSRAFARGYAEARSAPDQAWLSAIRVLDRRSVGGTIGMHCSTGHKRAHHHWTTTAFGGHAKGAA